MTAIAVGGIPGSLWAALWRSAEYSHQENRVNLQPLPFKDVSQQPENEWKVIDLSRLNMKFVTLAKSGNALIIIPPRQFAKATQMSGLYCMSTQPTLGYCPSYYSTSGIVRSKKICISSIIALGSLIFRKVICWVLKVHNKGFYYIYMLYCYYYKACGKSIKW